MQTRTGSHRDDNTPLRNQPRILHVVHCFYSFIYFPSFTPPQHPSFSGCSISFEFRGGGAESEETQDVSYSQRIQESSDDRSNEQTENPMSPYQSGRKACLFLRALTDQGVPISNPSCPSFPPSFHLLCLPALTVLLCNIGRQEDLVGNMVLARVSRARRPRG